MVRSKRLSTTLLGLALSAILLAQSGITVQAGSGNYLASLNGGVAVLFDPGQHGIENVSRRSVAAVALDMEFPKEEASTLVMANVNSALNVRSAPSEDAEKIGKLYKDCGGTILERGEGWTKLQSGNVIGWASNDYLLFDEEAEALANDVGKMIATINTETLRVRAEASSEAKILGLLPKGQIAEVLNNDNPDWICIDFEGGDGYVSAEYVTLDFQIDAGETIEEIKAREAAEREAKRHVNYGEYTTDADTTKLLAALIQCEAGGEPYEGQVAVGAVVMNRVRSAAYPDSIHGVIYASGQFTPAMNGKVNAVYDSGKIYASCLQAAEEALSGVSNVGDMTHFRRNNGRDGLVIGNHVFY